MERMTRRTPIKADKKIISSLFKKLSNLENNLHAQVKFYRTILDNCTSTLIKHTDRKVGSKIGCRYEILFLALAGKLLYDLGYKDTTLKLERATFISKVDDLVRKYVNQLNFSTIIRTKSIDPYKIYPSTTS